MPETLKMINNRPTMEEEEQPEIDSTQFTDKPSVDGTKKSLEEEVITKKKWTNRERVMVLCSRGTAFRERHLMQDFKTMLPHSKGESKLNKSMPMSELKEICEMRNCSKCLYFECKKKKDAYLWISNVLKGPSAKFLLHNIHTMGELKMSGNCLKGSRPLLSFSKDFETKPYLQLLKEVFIQTFSTPNQHPRSQPFIDHVINFSVSSDGRIWFRNYQIVDESEKKLEEIGPRMVMELIAVFEGSFGGAVLYQNPDYKSPNLIRREIKKSGALKYINRVEAQKSLETRKKENPPVDTDPLDSVFDNTGGVKRELESDESSDNNSEDEVKKEAEKIKRELETKKRHRKRKRAKKEPVEV